MARPKKNKPKEKVIRWRVTELEHKIIFEMADNLNLSVSDLMRLLVFGDGKNK